LYDDNNDADVYDGNGYADNMYCTRRAGRGREREK